MKTHDENKADDDERMDFDLIPGEDDQSIVTVDYKKYAHFLEDTDLSEIQKREFLQALWQIIVGFVDLGFGVHPAQQVQKTCGQLGKNAPKAALEAENEVKCKSKYLTIDFEHAADLETESGAERFDHEST